MDLPDVVRARRMVRSYERDRPVPVGAVTALLDLAIRAPSAGFTQGWDFLVLREPHELATFWRLTTDAGDPDSWLDGMKSAPVLILCLSDPRRYLERYAEPDKGWTDRDPARWPVPYWDVDTGMAALIMLLGAVDAGLAGCFFGVPPHRQAETLAGFGFPEDRRIVGVVSIGYPAPDRRSPSLQRGRRPIAEVAHAGSYGTPWPPADPPAAAAEAAHGAEPDAVPGAEPAAP
jgi:nitroreductase